VTVVLSYAVACAVTERMVYSIQGHNFTPHHANPPWERRLSDKLQRLRSDLSCLEELKAEWLVLLKCCYCHIMKLVQATYTTIEILKQKVVALYVRLSQYHKQALRRKQNKAF